MSEAVSWRPVAPYALGWREWDGEIVVYNDSTGDTHHLTPLAGKVFLALLRNPGGITISALIHLMSTDFAETEIASEIPRVLSGLAHLELAARTTA